MLRLGFGPTTSAYAIVRAASEFHAGGSARIAVAWAKDEGVAWFFDALEERAHELDVVIGLNDQGTSAEALIRLLSRVSRLRVFFKHSRQTFHPKIMCFMDGQEGAGNFTLIVGSSNLTVGGLTSNFECSMVVRGSSAANQELGSLLEDLNTYWEELAASPYLRQVVSVDDIRDLVEWGYVSTEAQIRNRERHGEGMTLPQKFLPSAPPERRRLGGFVPTALPFPEPQEVQPAPIEDTDPPSAPPLPDRFFVRTLTANDVAKIHGLTPGTFEPDLGEMARDRFPSFWGWPSNYVAVTRTLTRLEWRAQATLISRVTHPEGVPVTLTLWYRDPRLGHAAEHRFQLAPISEVREATPDDFDQSSIVLVERGAAGSGTDFYVRLVTSADAGYANYASYLTVERPEHHFGYGP